MTITEFLLARIAEDEAALERRGPFPHSTHSMDVVGSYNPRCPDCLGLPGKARVSAECAAKRAIIEEVFNYEQAADSDRGDCCSMDELKAGECRYIKPDKLPSLQALAAVYADHPDYRQEWAPNTPA